jgi:hypothetical protein
MNAMIHARERVKEFIEGKKKMEGKGRSLFNIEKECKDLIQGETVVNVTNDVIENMRRVFVASKFRGEEDREDVEVEEFFYTICEDEWLDRKLT